MTFKPLPALLLNADYRPVSYFPLSVWNWEHTMKAVVEDTVSVVAEYPDIVVHSPSVAIPLPSVIALRHYVPAPKYIAFTRFNVFLRDRFRCQYCNTKHSGRDLTFDHVLPRASGGLTTWDNIVAACFGCNSIKDDKHLKPLHPPHKPTAKELLLAQKEFPPNYLHESWMDYLYWDSPIES